jgi:hypothetical protein
MAMVSFSVLQADKHVSVIRLRAGYLDVEVARFIAAIDHPYVDALLEAEELAAALNNRGAYAGANRST